MICNELLRNLTIYNELNKARDIGWAVLLGLDNALDWMLVRSYELGIEYSYITMYIYICIEAAAVATAVPSMVQWRRSLKAFAVHSPTPPSLSCSAPAFHGSQ